MFVCVRVCCFDIAWFHAPCPTFKGLVWEDSGPRKLIVVDKLCRAAMLVPCLAFLVLRSVQSWHEPLLRGVHSVPL